MRPVVARVRAGEIEPKDIDAAIDDAVASWHASETEASLRDWLGMSDVEYTAWVAHPQVAASWSPR